MLKVTIEDNGVGREEARRLVGEKSHKSISTKSISERLGLLNRERGVDKSVETEDLFDASGRASGTRVTLWVSEI